jgi:hypothetical protein
MKVDDEIVELKEWDAVRVPPGTWRGYEAGPEASRSSSSARPISARIRATTSTGSAIGGIDEPRVVGQRMSAARIERAHSSGD